MPDRLIDAWAKRRLLPETYHHVFTPALCDALGDRLRGLEQARGWRRWQVRLAYAWAVATLVFYCLRSASRQKPRSARKEYLAMFARDVRHACRLFVREPAFSATVVVTLALGIGANASLFALVEAVLLRQLPYADAEALAIVRHRDARTGISKDFIAMGDFVDLRARQRTLQPFAGFGGFSSSLLGEGETLRVEGLAATPEIFAVLGATLARGRPFEDADVREGAPPVVIISHHLWETRFGSDPQITSRSAQFGATRRMIVGVAPRGFAFPPGQPTDVVVPVRTPLTAPAAAQVWMDLRGGPARRGRPRRRLERRARRTGAAVRA